MKYTIFLSALVALVTLSGCQRSGTVVSTSTSDILRGCVSEKVRFSADDGVSTWAIVVRCPAATVSTTTIEKNPHTTITIEGK